MYTDLMKNYKETFDSIGFIDGTWFSGIAFPIAALLVVLTIGGFVASVGYTDEIMKRKLIAKHGIDSEFVRKRYRDIKTNDLLYNNGKTIVIYFFILLTATVGYFFSASNSKATVNELDTIKVSILDIVMSDYLENGEYDLIELDGVIGLNFFENKYNLYKASFIHEDIQYKNKVVYFTYSDSLPSNVLIPFNPDLYSDLIPSDAERKSKNIGEVDSNEGFKFYSYPENSTLKHTTYIDDIDYIYNLKTAGE